MDNQITSYIKPPGFISEAQTTTVAGQLMVISYPVQEIDDTEL
jgi:hypothetical protein